MHILTARLPRNFLALGICLWLGACSTAQATLTATPSNSPTPASVIPASITPASIATAMPQASGTLLPPEPTSTSDSYATKVAGFAFSCDPYVKPSFSPSGSWAASTCGDGDRNFLEILNKDGKKWVLNYRDYFPAGTKDIPLGGLFPAHWTDDEKYLYYTFSIAYDGVGTCFYGFGDQGLYRISLADGKIATILPYTPAVLGYEIAFSPTGRRLAYQGNGNPVILDLQTGKEITMNIKGNTVGNFTWSPDGKELAFGACQVHKDGNDYAVTWSAIKIYSVQSQTSRTILEVEKDFLTIDGWSDDNVIAAERKDFKNLPTYLYIDASSGSFVTATPKP